jgi:predicted ATPase
MDVALLDAYRRKELILKDQARRDRAEQTRRLFTQNRWDTATCDGYMRWRASKIFDRVFVTQDEWQGGIQTGNTGTVYKLLCMYFAEDTAFPILAKEAKVPRADLRKGILLCGGVGGGKTWLMQLFSRNQRQGFLIVNSRKIAEDWKENNESIKQLRNRFELASNDLDNFYQTHLGLCIDDCGSEDIKNAYGNRLNVLGDLMESRYNMGNSGPFMHLTTNLTMEQFKEFYGDRVASRLRETMNIIELKTGDRRK